MRKPVRQWVTVLDAAQVTNMKPVTIKLESDKHYHTKMMLCAELALKQTVKLHVYETPLGCFRVKIGKTVIVEEIKNPLTKTLAG